MVNSSRNSNVMTELSILLADDEEDWFLLMRRAIAKAGIRNLVEHAKDGEGVIAALKRKLRLDEHDLPLFILLDLKMPRVDGLTALRWIRNQPQLDKVPVVVLTASEDDERAREAMQAGAEGYLVKSTDERSITFIYERAGLVRSGKLSRMGAFAGLPGGRMTELAHAG